MASTSSHSSSFSSFRSSAATTPPVDLEDEKPQLSAEIGERWGTHTSTSTETTQMEGGSKREGKRVKRSLSESLEDRGESEGMNGSPIEGKPDIEGAATLSLISGSPRRSRRLRSIAPTPAPKRPKREEEVAKPNVKVETEEEQAARISRETLAAASFRNLIAPDGTQANLFAFDEVLSRQLNLPWWMNNNETFTRKELKGSQERAYSKSTEPSRKKYRTNRYVPVSKRNIVNSPITPGDPFLDFDRNESGHWEAKGVHAGSATTFMQLKPNSYMYMGRYCALARVIAQNGEFMKARPEAQERAIDGFMKLGTGKDKDLRWLYDGVWLDGKNLQGQKKRDWIEEKLRRNEFRNAYHVMVCTEESEGDRREVEDCRRRAGR